MKIFFSYKRLLFICLLLFFQTSFAQDPNKNIDSLLKKVKILSISNPKQGLVLAKLAYANSLKGNLKLKEITSLRCIGLLYLNNRDFKNAHSYGRLCLEIAQKCKIDSLIGDCWYLNGYLFHIENIYGVAIDNYQQAAIFYSKNRLEKKLGKTYLSLGICEKRLSRFEPANAYYFKAADNFLKINDIADLSDTYNSIGLCFLSLNSLEKSVEYLHKALALRNKLKSNVLVAQSFNNIGFVYKEYNEPDSAINYLSKSVELYQKEKDSSLLVLPLQNLGSSRKMKGDFKSAGNYIKRSLRIAVNYGLKEDIARGNLDLAELYLAQKNYKGALAAASVTLNTAKTLKLPELLMNAYADEFNIYLREGNYKAAVFYDNKKDKLKDSIFSIAKDKAINELEIKYQTNLKEKDIATLNLQNKLQSKTVAQQKLSIIVLIIGAVLLSLLFVIAYNNYRIKDKANHKIQHLMQELHHRVKNNLQILSGLFLMQIETLGDEATKNALRENETRLASMNLIHNKLYLDHSNTKIEMEEYLTKLVHHIKDSFDGGTEKNISLRIEAEPVMIEADKAVAIGLIVNELTTNAFKYAFDNKAGEIYLGLKQEGSSKVLLTISDNGKGLQKADKEKAPSFGLRLVGLMANQLYSRLIIKNEKGVSYQMEINI